MVFQDGGGFVRDKGHTRVPIVFDNLISRKALPPTVGIFVNPGIIPGAEKDRQPRRNRAFEYDTVSTDYANFLIDEIIPFAVKTHNLNLSENPVLAELSAEIVPGGSPHSLLPGTVPTSSVE